MKVKKGPYGCYLTERISDESKIYSYSLEVINEGILSSLIPMYIDNSELIYDISDLLPISSYTSHKHNYQTTRAAIGSFLETICIMDRYLLSPSMVYLNSEHLYEDSKGNIKLIYMPYCFNENKLDINFIEDIEILLEEAFFQAFLLSDEISRIVYAIKNNDKNILMEVITKLQSQDRKISLVINNDIKLSLLFALITIILLFLELKYATILGIAISTFFLISTIIKDRKHTKSRQKEEETPRKMILFDEKKKIRCLILENPLYGRAIYSKEALIGSDSILSDVIIEEASVSSLHVKITYRECSYYVIDLSFDNRTYLDDRRLNPSKEYEIKNNEILRLGDLDFKINTECFKGRTE